ncbi:D-glycero-beta-D-manno-heptose 1,7-bisphosphate 7-phosphatase [Aliarcobacter butzleri]|uniref:D-glycero-beta-D-manno-heptose 1,7-bisphosphate 7-phosphatase n=1 Tax=Aliarcobacter butzleri TaxID=28197 RepID=UPI00344DF107
MEKGFFIQTNKKKIIYLDRDGVINKDFGYVYEIDKFEFINGVFEACKYFINLGYEIIVVTNQSGIGRNYYTKEDFIKLTNWMKNEFKKNGINILNVYFCPHAPEENCNCRKPQIGMITQSLNDFDIDLQKSWLIGDKMSDIQTAISANIPNKILISKEKDDKVLHVVETLFDTINIIKQ